MYLPLAAAGWFVVLAAPVPKDKAGVLYYPVQEKAKLVYRVRHSDAEFERTETVTNAEEKDGVYRVTVESVTNGKAEMDGVFEVSNKGLARVSSGKSALAKPWPLLKLPLKLDDRWEYATSGDGGPESIIVKLAVAKLDEEVEVAAGKFKAVRVEQCVDVGGTAKVKSTPWYAPGVGLVKSEAGSDSKRRTVRELKAITVEK